MDTRHAAEWKDRRVSIPVRKPHHVRLTEAVGPPLTPDELTGSLTLLERRLNQEMKCPMGRNQVYIRSVILGGGTTRPRIALKCPLRRDLKQAPDVFFEHIQKHCCDEHTSCEAWRALEKRRDAM